jgi:hypothetical protein
MAAPTPQNTKSLDLRWWAIPVTGNISLLISDICADFLLHFEHNENPMETWRRWRMRKCQASGDYDV